MEQILTFLNYAKSGKATPVGITGEEIKGIQTQKFYIKSTLRLWTTVEKRNSTPGPPGRWPHSKAIPKEHDCQIERNPDPTFWSRNLKSGKGTSC